MAAGLIYTIGGSFWEFGGPDLDRAKLFVMIGTAEDHHSNPLKIAISKFKRDGGRFISINPVRTGYSAIADEWVPIRPGADPCLLGEFEINGTPVMPAFQLLVDRVKDYTPEWAEGITGIPAETIRRLAYEMGVTARDQKIELPISWTDAWGPRT
jgi:anaerobic selenocysteine-containing dehydrogenase